MRHAVNQYTRNTVSVIPNSAAPLHACPSPVAAQTAPGATTTQAVVARVAASRAARGAVPVHQHVVAPRAPGGTSTVAACAPRRRLRAASAPPPRMAPPARTPHAGAAVYTRCGVCCCSAWGSASHSRHGGVVHRQRAAQLRRQGLRLAAQLLTWRTSNDCTLRASSHSRTHASRSRKTRARARSRSPRHDLRGLCGAARVRYMYYSCSRARARGQLALEAALRPAARAAECRQRPWRAGGGTPARRARRASWRSSTCPPCPSYVHVSRIFGPRRRFGSNELRAQMRPRPENTKTNEDVNEARRGRARGASVSLCEWAARRVSV